MSDVLHQYIRGRPYIEATLLSGIAALNDGGWVRIEGYDVATVEVDGISNASVEVRGSVAPVKPVDSAHGFLVGEAFVADGALVIQTTPLRWIKARVSDYTSGTINCYLWGT